MNTPKEAAVNFAAMLAALLSFPEPVLKAEGEIVQKISSFGDKPKEKDIFYKSNPFDEFTLLYDRFGKETRVYRK